MYDVIPLSTSALEGAISNNIRTTSGHHTSSLARYASTETFDAIPLDVVNRLKYLMLDGFGCGIYGSSLPWSRTLADAVTDLGGIGKTAVWGTNRYLAADQAALLNGSFIQAFELDDYSRDGGFHACSLVLPAALAACTLRGDVTGQDLVAATVVGFEIGNRVGRCIDPTRVTSRGWHTGSIIGPLAAAASAGNILRLDTEQMQNAFGIAATQAGGLMSVQFGSMVKRMHHGRASQSGFFAAALAARGYTGIRAVFEQPYGGYCSTFAGSVDERDLDALISGLGDEYLTLSTCVKPYACRGPINVAVDALRTIRQTRDFAAAEVVEVRVRCTTATMEKCGWEYLATGSATEAQMNMTYGIAAMILEGDVFIDQFRDELLTDREVLSLTRRVSIVEDASLDKSGVGHRHKLQLEVELSDGSVLKDERDHARGSSVDPLSNDLVSDKYDKLANARGWSKAADRVKELVLGIESMTDTRQLSIALAEA
jgi:2-methylcitrate dehydratase PrpD